MLHTANPPLLFSWQILKLMVFADAFTCWYPTHGLNIGWHSLPNSIDMSVFLQNKQTFLPPAPLFLTSAVWHYRQFPFWYFLLLWSLHTRFWGCCSHLWACSLSGCDVSCFILPSSMGGFSEDLSVVLSSLSLPGLVDVTSSTSLLYCPALLSPPPFQSHLSCPWDFPPQWPAQHLKLHTFPLEVITLLLSKHFPFPQRSHFHQVSQLSRILAGFLDFFFVFIPHFISSIPSPIMSPPICFFLIVLADAGPHGCPVDYSTESPWFGAFYFVPLISLQATLQNVFTWQCLSWMGKSPSEGTSNPGSSEYNLAPSTHLAVTDSASSASGQTFQPLWECSHLPIQASLSLSFSSLCPHSSLCVSNFPSHPMLPFIYSHPLFTTFLLFQPLTFLKI